MENPLGFSFEDEYAIGRFGRDFPYSPTPPFLWKSRAAVCAVAGQSYDIDLPRDTIVFSFSGSDDFLVNAEGYATLPTFQTNYLPNNSMTGAVLGLWPNGSGMFPDYWNPGFTLPGEVQSEIVGIGTIAGLDYIDVHFFGTTTAARTQYCYFFPSNTVFPAVAGETLLFQLKLALLSGTLSTTLIRHRVIGINNVGGASENYLSPVFQAALTPDLSLQEFDQTLVNAATVTANAALALTFPAADTFDFVLRIASPQMQKGIAGPNNVRTGNGPKTEVFGGHNQGLYNPTSHLFYANHQKSFKVSSPVAGTIVTMACLTKQ